jgi:hypothetical protein
MRKIASPKELQAELVALIDYCDGHQPSREVVASKLQKLASRVVHEWDPERNCIIYATRDRERHGFPGPQVSKTTHFRGTLTEVKAKAQEILREVQEDGQTDWMVIAENNGTTLYACY